MYIREPFPTSSLQNMETNHNNETHTIRLESQWSLKHDSSLHTRYQQDLYVAALWYNESLLPAMFESWSVSRLLSSICDISPLWKFKKRLGQQDYPHHFWVPPPPKRKHPSWGKKRKIIPQDLRCFNPSKQVRWHVIQLIHVSIRHDYTWGSNKKKKTPPKLNTAPEKWWLEDYFPFGSR